MLAVLLDGGVPEGEAVWLAGDCTANEICRHRARLVLAALERGINSMTPSAPRQQRRISLAVDERDARARRIFERVARLARGARRQSLSTGGGSAHAITSGLVILNGVLVALIATGMFGIALMALNV